MRHVYICSFQELTAAQKYEIVLSEYEYLNAQMAILEKNNMDELARLEARIEETKLEIEEIRHEAFDFNRAVLEVSLISFSLSRSLSLFLYPSPCFCVVLLTVPMQ